MTVFLLSVVLESTIWTLSMKLTVFIFIFIFRVPQHLLSYNISRESIVQSKDLLLTKAIDV